MAIGLTEEHEALAASVGGLAERHLDRAAIRRVVAAAERGSDDGEFGPGSAFWTAAAEQGLLGVHLPEEYGGQGYSLVELAVVLEELGRALVPGPYVPTVLAGAIIAAADDDKARAELLPALADGSRTAAAAFSPHGILPAPNATTTSPHTNPASSAGTWDALRPNANTGGGRADLGSAGTVAGAGDGLGPNATTGGGRAGLEPRGAVEGGGADFGAGGAVPGGRAGVGAGGAVAGGGLWGIGSDGGLVVSGGSGPVVGAGVADLLVLSVGTEEGERWVVVSAEEVRVEALEGLDLTRGVASVHADGLFVPAARVLTVPDAGRIGAVVLGAEACGVAGWAVEAATAYAKMREQFGRPIGQFQGVKHLCARMLIALERARAAVWDAARAADDHAAGIAGILAPDAAVRCAEGCIQVHGGVGYTFEHEAHLYYRRAMSLRAMAGRASDLRAAVAARALAGERREMSIDLGDEAAPVRERIRAEAAELALLDPLTQRAAMADGGWVTPHLPRPWGREASPQEQIIIQQELKAAGVRPVPLMIAAWAVPSLVQFGTEEQKQRFLPPTLRGEIIWCQLFSEPGAGSDLAGLSTRAVRTEGGWLISGQKIWTSLAREAQWAICIARTDPDAPKHEGITYFVVDMASPGLEIRPLRECTGDAIFNEVFLDEVFVPDELVVGPVNAGWRVARNTLANERVGLTSSFQLGGDVKQLVELVHELGLADDPLVRDGVGRLAADEHAFQLLGLRATLKQLSGTDPGATANVRKLVAMEHGQEVTEFGFGLLGSEGALTGGAKSELRRRWTRYMLASRAMTIGGGTTEVNLNVIGERILSLPRG